MSTVSSISTRRRYGVARVCRVWGVARAGVYRNRRAAVMPPSSRRRPGPQGPMPDAALVEAIRRVLTDSPFHGEGYRKVWARLRHAGLRTSRERVRRLMRENGLSAMTRVGRPRGPRNHDGTIIPEFEVVSRKGGPPRDYWRLLFHEVLNERAVVIEVKGQARTLAAPRQCAKTLPCRTPARLHSLTFGVAPHPRCEIIELLTVWQDCRKTDDPPIVGVLTAKESLYQDFIVKLALARTDEMPLVEHDETDIIDQLRIASERKIQLFGVAITISRNRSASWSPGIAPLAP